MWIIAGLGNPGRQYQKTRHNVGFMVIDRLSERFGIETETKKHQALIGKGMIRGQKVLLVKPQTYMNLSGESLQEIVHYYNADPQKDLLVIYDDISLEPGQLRLRAKGSAGGHNGIKSMIARLGTQNFRRIRVGVGEKPEGYDLADYVLGHFSKETKAVMEESMDRAAEAVVCVIENGFDAAMNRYNQKPEKPDTEKAQNNSPKKGKKAKTDEPQKQDSLSNGEAETEKRSVTEKTAD